MFLILKDATSTITGLSFFVDWILFRSQNQLPQGQILLGVGMTLQDCMKEALL